MTKESLLKYMEQQWAPGLDPAFGELLITAGAGDIDALVQPIKSVVSGE